VNEITENLKLFYDKVNDQKIFWILSGSTSLFIQRVDIIPNDIDIVTNKDGVDSIDKILSDYCIQKPNYSSTKEYRSYYGKYLLNGIKVDLVGEFQYKKKDGTWSEFRHTLEYFQKDYNGMSLLLLPLEEELKEYEELDKVEKVKKIKKRLEIE
jgi:hypothetical protein